jgi:hypothetical protein
METPPPVNISALSALLAKSKNVMKAVDAAKPIALSEVTLKQTAAEAAAEASEAPQSLTPRAAAGYTREQVMNSNFPPAIKEMMLKSVPTQSLILEDTSDLDDVVMTPNKRAPITKQVVNETRTSNSDLITVSKSELKSMINEAISKFFTEAYNKNLTEATIKQTVRLIQEGKIIVKKK